MRRSELVLSATEVVSEQGVVAAGDLREAEAGVSMLEEGGNAIDGLVAAAFVGFVVEPDSCGVAGSGHLALYPSGQRRFVSIDHNVRAPSGARPDMFEIDEAQPANYYGAPGVIGRRNEVNGLAVGVPGAVAGLCTAHEGWGKLPLAQVLEPAIAVAEAGVPVNSKLLLAISRRFEEISGQPEAADFLLRRGAPPRAADAFQGGDLLDTSELARTLREIAKRGPAGFYTGWVAEAIERAVRRLGGVLTAADLAAYEPAVTIEKGATYRDVAYATAGDPVGYETLNIIDRFDLTRFGSDSVEYRHLMAEAMGHAFADNVAHYGDPDVVPSPVGGLSSREFAAARAAVIELDRAAPRPIVAGDPWPYERDARRGGAPVRPSAGGPYGTSHMAAADREGNLAALCTTLTTWFGSIILVPGTGVLLNNTMQDFDARPGRPNSIAPGKRPMFAVPTLVAATDGEGTFAASGAGGYRITTCVLHPFVNVVDFDMAIQEAVDAPRVYCQGDGTFVDDRISAHVRERLASLGHDIIAQQHAPPTVSFARVGAIRRDPATGLVHAGANPALATAAAGV